MESNQLILKLLNILGITIIITTETMVSFIEHLLLIRHYSRPFAYTGLILRRTLKINDFILTYKGADIQIIK